jgi:hypothetical protein
MRTLNGDAVANPEPTIDGDGLERARDLHMLALAAQGWPLRAIAKLFFTNATAVHRRLRGIPAEVVEHHISTGFDGLL